MNPGWQISKANFTKDDGSLPGVEFRDLTSDSVRRIVSYFFTEGTIDSPETTVHDLIAGKDVLISAVSDPTGMVFSGAASHFHCCFSGLSWNKLSLPVLGLFVFSDSLEIDYRMGGDWIPEKVDAFFGLLSHLISLAPEAIVDSAYPEGLPFPGEFGIALDHYAPHRKHEDAEQSVAPNRSLPPTLNSTSSVRGSED